MMQPQEVKDKIRSKLGLKAKVEMDRLKPKQFVGVARAANKIYRFACPLCQAKIINETKSIQNIDNLCAECQGNYDIIKAFKKLEKIYKKIK